MGGIEEKVTALRKLQDDVNQLQFGLSTALCKTRLQFSAQAEKCYADRAQLIRSRGEETSELWLCALLNHPSLCEMVTRGDIRALRTCVDVRIRVSGQQSQESLAMQDVDFLHLRGQQSWTLELDFNNCRFFEDTTLSVTFNYADGNLFSVTSPGVRWHPGLQLTAKQGGAGDGPRRYKYSIFLLFEPSAPPRDTQTALFADAEKEEIARYFRDELVPRGHVWFLKDPDAARETEDAQSSSDSDDDDDEDEEEEDDDDDSDEDDDDENADKAAAAAQVAFEEFCDCGCV